MKYSKIIASLLILTSSLWATTVIGELDGYSESTRIIIQWTTQSEADVIGFEVQRSTDGKTFFEIGFLQAQGQSSSYTYIDDSIIAKVSGHDYHYRIKIKTSSGESKFSEIITIRSTASLNYTWGSLKALFK